MKGRLLKKQHWALKGGSRAGLRESGHHGPACPDVSTRGSSTANLSPPSGSPRLPSPAMKNAYTRSRKTTVKS